MRIDAQWLRRNGYKVLRFLPIISFVFPLLILYSVDPNSFEKTWQGRTYQLFFVWLCFLEIILNGDEMRTAVARKKPLRTFFFAISLALPTAYVVAANFFGLNSAIFKFAEASGVGEHWALLIPLSTEYLVFMGFFVLIVMLEYGYSGLKDYALPVFFLGIIGGLYTIDNLYPWGRFAPFQMIVPTTTFLSARLLNLLGYQTSTFTRVTPEYGYTPYLFAANAKGSFGAGIAWPCAGIESLLIYIVTILLFLSKSAIPWRQRIVYFLFGAIVTYFINVLRIATIFVIQINQGTAARQAFHDYYGQLYSIIWIVSYPLIIVGSRTLWTSIRKGRTSTKAAANTASVDSTGLNVQRS